VIDRSAILISLSLAAPEPEEIPGKVTIQELFLPELPIFCLNCLGGFHGQRYWVG